MELQDAINQRHSIRQFTDKPVEKKMITKIVELAQRAPSWVNSQPWQVYCAMGDTLQEIKNAYRDQDIAANIIFSANKPASKIDQSGEALGIVI